MAGILATYMRLGCGLHVTRDAARPDLDEMRSCRRTLGAEVGLGSYFSFFLFFLFFLFVSLEL